MSKSIRTIFIMLCCILIMPCKVGATVISSEVSSIQNLAEEAKTYALTVIPDMLASAINDSNFDININNYDHLYIAQPFCILNIENEKIINDEKYNFFILEDREIKALLSVYNVQGEWNATLSTELVKELDKLPEKGTWIFYSENECIYAESLDDLIMLSNNNCKKTNFINYRLLKRKDLLSSYDTYSKSDIIEKWRNITINTDMLIYKKSNNIENISAIGAKSDSPFITDNNETTILNMSGCKVSQNGYPICWAATVATIVRYVNGNATLTAEQVCSQNNQPFFGASVDVFLEALKYYNIEYTHTQSQLTWSKIKNNLKNKKPINLCAVSGEKGHSVC